MSLLLLLLLSLTRRSDAAPCGEVDFTSSFGDGMVLQRFPEAASVYGQMTHLSGKPCPPPPRRPHVTVTVFTDGVEGEAGGLYSVEAEVFDWALGSCAFRALLRPTPAGGSYSISARCHDGVSKHEDDTSGKYIATIRNVTFGDVWYCSGQSNQALSLRYTTMRNISLAKVKEGQYDNIRIHGIKGLNMNPAQKWSTARNAIREGSFLDFSGTCWYFAERLSDELRKEAMDAGPPPIGLIHTAYGGSTIEDWLDKEAIASCDNVCHEQVIRGGHSLFESNALPYVNMTLKGWIWYQGENNLGNRPKPCVLGNSLRQTGYSCLLVKLVKSWRAHWSATPGTTDPLAPFGIVALPHSGSEGNPHVGTMRWAQTGSYGVLPNPAMLNTFLVQAFDVDDPYQKLYNLCFQNGCCFPAKGLSEYSHEPGKCQDSPTMKARYAGFECNMCPDLCGDFCKSAIATNFYMGPIHPRTKMAVGSRLGLAAARTVYRVGGDHGGAAMGPTLAGCRMDNSKDSGSDMLTLLFNRSLLSGDTVHVQEYHPGLSKLEVLIKPTKGLCLQSVNGNCIDDGYGVTFALESTSSAWVPVDIITAGSRHEYEVKVNMSSIEHEAYAIRYAWEGTCCDGGGKAHHDLESLSRHCPLGSCPIIASPSGLPANPFLAELIDGKCKCLPPQECDAIEMLQLVTPGQELPVNTATPTEDPTKSPPTSGPSTEPSAKPTPGPTNAPTANPTKEPSDGPTDSPTVAPSRKPSAEPTPTPTVVVATRNRRGIPSTIAGRWTVGLGLLCAILTAAFWLTWQLRLKKWEGFESEIVALQEEQCM